jgi:hypothetical protein
VRLVEDGEKSLVKSLQPKHLQRFLFVQVKNLLEPLYCTLLQAPAGGPTDQPFTNKAGSTEAFQQKDRKKVFVTHEQHIVAGSVMDLDPDP